jgi:DNA-binding transcriptional MerR regulator
MKEKTKKDGLLKLGELAQKTGLRLSTLSFWSSIGLLPFEQAGFKLVRRYPEREALKRIREIQELKRKRLTLPEIIERLKGEKER